MTACRFMLPFAWAALVSAGVLLISGCSAHADDAGGNATASLSIDNAAAGSGNGMQSVSINVPGFSAKVDVPDLDLGSDTTKIENLQIFPGTKINGVKIMGQANGSGVADQGNVEMGFTAPADAAKIVAWYRDQAQKGGWTIMPPAGGNQFEATREGGGEGSDHKGTTHFALQVADSSAGSGGRFFVSGH